MTERKQGGASKLLPLVKEITVDGDSGAARIVLKPGVSLDQRNKAAVEFNKSRNETTHLKFSGSLGIKLKEYEVVVGAHSVAPEHAVRPIGSIWNSDGAFAGYFMERIRGVTLGIFAKSPHSVEHAERIGNWLTEYLDRIHAAGYYHGDLNGPVTGLPSNVMVVVGGATLSEPAGIRALDPGIWTGLSDRGPAYWKNQDRIVASRIIDLLRHTATDFKGTRQL